VYIRSDSAQPGRSAIESIGQPCNTGLAGYQLKIKRSARFAASGDDDCRTSGIQGSALPIDSTTPGRSAKGKWKISSSAPVVRGSPGD
jgi:hypothetical protein